MGRIKTVFNDNKLFFIGYIIILILGSSILFTNGKLQTFYLLNPYHHLYLNYLFYFFTILGDGFFCVPLAFAFLIIKRKRLFWLLLSSYIVSGIIVLLLKNFIDEARPSMFDDLKNYPYFIEHITLHNMHGFPSGHTASAFGGVSVLAFYSRSKIIPALILLIVGMLIGYSRIYLGQHFISDVMVGSVIGVASGIFCWIVVNKKFYAKNFSQKEE